jgi:sugar phosphate isomerase/epimerase
VQITLKAGMVTNDAAARVHYCRDVGFDATQEAAASIPGAAERGYPTAAELRDHRQRFDDEGIAVVALAPVRESRAWAAPETEEGRQAFDAFARTLDAAGAAGIPTVTLHPPLDGATGEQEAAEQFRRNCDFYARASERAREAGVRLATHSPWPPLKGLWGAREFGSLFEAVPAPENGILFCFGCLHMAGDDVVAAMRPLRDRIAFVHVRDVRMDRRPWAPGTTTDEVFLGDGEVHPDRCLRALHRLGYDGPICPEHLPVIAGERKQEISTAWAAGYLKSQLATLKQGTWVEGREHDG